MAKEKIPAWQQVLLIALNNIPHREDGHDAWNKLNDEEKAAVMDFLTEHCGENAQAALEETCGKIKHPKWWAWFWVIFSMAALVAALFLLMDWWESWTDMHILPFVWLILCPLNMYTAWKGNPTAKMQKLWTEGEETREGTMDALNDMYRACTAPRKDRMDKWRFFAHAALLVLWGFAAAGEIADSRPPSVPQQIVSVLEDAADGKASLAEAGQLLEGSSELQWIGRVDQVWDKTAKWSDERYLAAAFAVRLNHPNAPDYAREALLTTRLGAIDTPVESAEFAALLALCDADTVQSVRARVEAAEFPEKTAVLAAFE